MANYQVRNPRLSRTPYIIKAGPMGPRGPQGIVGPVGPPNVLTVGSVITGAAGSSATAQITGTAPNQVIAFTIPRGIQGIQGNQGNVGPAGPPNSLAIGTVTTDSTGTAATATITGAAPSQTLNLSIPQGVTRWLVEVGGAYPARPAPVSTPVVWVGNDDPASVGADVRDGDTWDKPSDTASAAYVRGLEGRGSPLGTVSALPGTTYTDLDGTAGAWQWIKVGGGNGTLGWQVTEGDTGRRDVTSLMTLPANMTSTEKFYLRRIGRVCTISVLDAINFTAAFTPVNLGVMPAGFRVLFGESVREAIPSRFGSGVAGMFRVLSETNGSAISIASSGSTGGAAVTIRAIWLTDDPWPTVATLPGTGA